MELSGEQQKAKDMVLSWMDSWTPGSQRQIFRLFGYAGTGKTTTIRSIVEDIGGFVGFGAYTGKAALVMRKQELPAQTLHSLIYRPVPPDKKKCEELYKRIQEGETHLKKDLADASKVQFELDVESELEKMDLLVLDECSMVNDAMLQDLLLFKTPILVLGDPGQLPPIEGTGALIRDTPDIVLKEIHRQGADSPIIDFATRARNGISLPLSDSGPAKHVKARDFGDVYPYLKGAPQVITGKNNTRRYLNQRLRPGSSMFPEVGERLICLRNDSQLGLFNGLMVEVLEVGDQRDSSIELVIKSELEDSEPQNVLALSAYFQEYEIPKSLEAVKWWQRRDIQEFDFGYAITVHKAQGSQWPSILFVDDGFYVWDRKMRHRWLYTGITRAAEDLTIVSK